MEKDRQGEKSRHWPGRSIVSTAFSGGEVTFCGRRQQSSVHRPAQVADKTTFHRTRSIGVDHYARDVPVTDRDVFVFWKKSILNPKLVEVR
jgi:hypothetical protein